MHATAQWRQHRAKTLGEPMPGANLQESLDPRGSFGAAVAVYLRQLYPVDTETRVLNDIVAAGFPGKTAPGVTGPSTRRQSA